MPQSPLRAIIVGGGVMGLSCAWCLAKGGAQVTVLEAKECGHGATLASLGALWPPSPLINGTPQQMHRESLWRFESFVRELEADAGIPIRFQRQGRLEILENARAADRAREETRVILGHWPPLEFLEPTQWRETQPAFCEAPFGALLCRGTAHVDVFSLVKALMHACMAKFGVTIRQDTMVTDWRMNGDAIAEVIAGPHATAYPADAVLVTAGAWTGQLPPLGMSGHVAPVAPVKGQAIAVTMPKDPAGNPILQTIVKRGPIYLVPAAHRDEVLIGATTEPEAGFHDTPTDEALEYLKAGASDILPALRTATFLRHWAGLRPRTQGKGHPPLMEKINGTKNAYVCAGHFKTGIGMAPYASKAMAEMILQTI